MLELTKKGRLVQHIYGYLKRDKKQKFYKQHFYSYLKN